MKAIIILGSAAMSIAMQAQQQQIILVNNLGNSNIILNNVSFSNVQLSHIQSGSNNARPVQIRNITRAVATQNISQLKASNEVKKETPQVRRRTTARPRTVINTSVNNPVQVLNAPPANIIAPNEIMPEQNFVVVNDAKIQTQGISNFTDNQGSNLFVQQENDNAQKNFNSDLSLNLKGVSLVRSKATSSSSYSSSHSKFQVFSKKMAKFKRKFFGKLSSHKKGNHRLDMCFNWKN